MNYKEFKEKCESSNRFKDLTKEQKKRYNLEIKLAKRYYNNEVDLEEELKKKTPNNKNVIPYLLGYTNSIELNDLEYKQIKPVGSGGLDIDNDLIPSSREEVLNYFKEKYGDENVIQVGTYSTLKLKAAIKDVLRVYKVDYKEVNAFTKDLDSSLSFKENLDNIILTDPWRKSFYEKHKEKFDIAEKLVGKTRGCLPFYQKVDTAVVPKRIIDLDPNIDSILYLDKEKNIRSTKRYSVFSSGVKKVYEITTESGKKIQASEEHKFFLKNGEVKELKDLKIGDELIVK